MTASLCRLLLLLGMLVNVLAISETEYEAHPPLDVTYQEMRLANDRGIEAPGFQTVSPALAEVPILSNDISMNNRKAGEGEMPIADALEGRDAMATGVCEIDCDENSLDAIVIILIIIIVMAINM